MSIVALPALVSALSVATPISAPVLTISLAVATRTNTLSLAFIVPPITLSRPPDLVRTWPIPPPILFSLTFSAAKKTHARKGSQYSIAERRVLELIPVLASQPVGDVSHKPGGRLPLLSARHAVTLTTLKRAATNFFAAWWTEARWVWTVCLRLLRDSVAAAIWTQDLLRLSPAC